MKPQFPSFATCHSRPDNLKITLFKSSTLYFWENIRQKFNLFISDYAIEECERGDSAAARRRLEFLDGITVIP
ncbi:MAG: hypothetical protein LBK52_00950, partial [Deltaproteobacteria bacterium]|nr:hypothetical protein [Deltaproteobacteria bacterium]